MYSFLDYIQNRLLNDKIYALIDKFLIPFQVLLHQSKLSKDTSKRLLSNLTPTLGCFI